jgi:hypothetical protein
MMNIRPEELSPEEHEAAFGNRAGDRVKVPELCPGIRMHPTAEVGHRWLTGETLSL